jgi:hypothetical protein
MEQQAHGLEVWMQPFVTLRAPKLFNVRSDPFERAEFESGDYVKWFIEHLWVFVPAQSIVGQHIASFQNSHRASDLVVSRSNRPWTC